MLLRWLYVYLNLNLNLWFHLADDHERLMAADNARKCLRLCNLGSLFYLIYESESWTPSPPPLLSLCPYCSGSKCIDNAHKRLHVVLMIMDNYDGSYATLRSGGVAQLKAKGLDGIGWASGGQIAVLANAVK